MTITEYTVNYHRALILKFLQHEKRLCQRENRTFKGLTYAQIRNRFLMEKGYIPTVGNRCRELRKDGLVRMINQDGRMHVYPVELHINHWET